MTDTLVEQFRFDARAFREAPNDKGPYALDWHRIAYDAAEKLEKAASALAELKRDLESSNETRDFWFKAAGEEKAAATRLQGEVDALKEALKPFASANRYLIDDLPDDYCPDWSPFIPYGAYRRARTLIEKDGTNER